MQCAPHPHPGPHWPDGNELALFRTIDSSPARRPPRFPILRTFGFVLHNSPPAPRPCGPVPPGTTGNWVRFARLPRVPRLGASSHPAPPGIGFVLHNSAPRRACPERQRIGRAFLRQAQDGLSPDTFRGAIGFVSRDRSRRSQRGGWQIGFVSHDCPERRQRFRPCWMASSPIGAGQIGFVLPSSVACRINHNFFSTKHLPFLTPATNWVCFAR
jgi:hypothetical protein